MNEEYRDIKGYEGLYQVSNFGTVRSLKYRKKEATHTLNPFIAGKGRVYVTLSANGKKHNKLVHRLVAEAFIPNPCGYEEINHIDENPKNNTVSNLEWCNRRYNNAYSFSKEVAQIKDGKVINVFPNAKEAWKVTGAQPGAICCCANHKPRYKTAGGYSWEYTGERGYIK